MAVPKRKRKLESGETVREVFVGNEWKKDSRAGDLNEWLKLAIIVLTSFGFFKGGELTFSKITDQEKYDQDKRQTVAIDWAYNADKTLEKHSLTINDVAKHVDPDSKEYSQIHLTPYNANVRFATKDEIEKISEKQTVIIKELSNLKISNAILVKTLNKLDRSVVRLGDRIK